MVKKKTKIVLKSDLEKLGLFGQIKEVAAGYARNYLIKKGLALYLSDPKAKVILKKAEEVKKKKEAEIEKLKKISKKLESLVLEIEAKVGERGKLYQAIKAEDVASAILEKTKIEIDKKQIEMEPLKEIGEKEALIKLGQGIETKVKIIAKAKLKIIEKKVKKKK